MDQSLLDAFAAIPQPERSSYRFVEELKHPQTYAIQPGNGLDAGAMTGRLAQGVTFLRQDDLTGDFPETALESLRRVLDAKAIPVTEGGFCIRFRQQKEYSHEEHEVEVTPEGICLRAGDADGMRRALYLLEEKLLEAEGASAMPGCWHRRPFVRHRISRCFFGPTNRPPFNIDELTNDVDYYPEAYLDKLAHEGINGLWLTVYFADLPSSLFPGHGKDAARRLAKLALTARRCARYGIRIYVFLSEPKLFGNNPHNLPPEEGALHPGIVGTQGPTIGTFCTSSEAGRRYLRESIGALFSAVPALGGVINIMTGEDNGSCAGIHLSEGRWTRGECPLCSRRSDAEIFRDEALLYTNEMRRYTPDAVYIGWFYLPAQRDGGALCQRMLEVAKSWPEEATLMLNFESGGASQQLGRQRIVFDYSLAYVGPSSLFADCSSLVRHAGAKLQVGCSHEDASVPFIPVPENLYDKYSFMEAKNVDAAMQCWYFGNYPGLMNRAAGALSFQPFPKDSMAFLEELARPFWRRDAATVAQAWHLFSQAYRNFPSNLCFEWYGPLHHSICWPLHLFPVDQGISPSWLLEQFPRISGDRIGEIIGYHHTLDEALELCRRMRDLWQQGLELLSPLKATYANDGDRLADIRLAEAVGLQMKSTANVLEFYKLREEMLYLRKDNLPAMADVVRDEMACTRRMLELCRQDSRLGYHSEAEGYLFFPARLEARLGLLEELLQKDFPRFDIHADWISGYTGEKTTGPCMVCTRPGGKPLPQRLENGLEWRVCQDGDTLEITIDKIDGRGFCVEIEPCRMWMPLRVSSAPGGTTSCYDMSFAEVPAVQRDRQGDTLRIRVPLELFKGFRRPGFPMRINIRSYYDDSWSWVPGKVWPGRLLQTDYNPACMGWLIDLE